MGFIASPAKVKLKQLLTRDPVGRMAIDKNIRHEFSESDQEFFENTQSKIDELRSTLDNSQTYNSQTLSDHM